MSNIGQKSIVLSETISAIFIIAFISLYILAGFAAGFILPLFILTMAIGAGIAFFHPRSGMAAIIFLTFIFERFFTLQPIVMGRVEYKLYPLDIVFGAVILGILFALIKRGSTSLDQIDLKRSNLKRADYYLITFIILTAIYFFVSAFVLKNDFSLSFSSFKNYAFYSLFYFAILFLIEKKEQVLWLFKFALAGAIGIIFFIVYGLINGAGLWSEFTPLSTEGIRTLAFTHAFYLSMVLLCVITYLIFEKNKHRKLYLTLVVIWTIGIIGSMMRHLWIGIFLSIVALFFILSRENRLNLKRILLSYTSLFIAASVILIYLSLLFPTSAIKDMKDSVSNVIASRISSLASVSSDESFSWRSVVWKEAAKEYLKSPILGIGLGKKIYVEAENYRDFVEVRNIHNSPLILLVQMGIAVFAVFAIFALKNLKKLYKKTGKDWMDMALMAILINYFIVFLFQPYLETNMLGIFFWIILGLIRVKSYENIRNK